MSSDWTNLKLPTKFVEKMIDPLIEKSEGYDSRGDVVKEAIRRMCKDKKIVEEK